MNILPDTSAQNCLSLLVENFANIVSSNLEFCSRFVIALDSKWSYRDEIRISLSSFWTWFLIACSIDFTFGKESSRKAPERQFRYLRVFFCLLKSQKVKRGACFRWSIRPNFAWGSIETKNHREEVFDLRYDLCWPSNHF